QALAYLYSRATETDAMQAKVLTDDEARRVAVNIARLPELLGASRMMVERKSETAAADLSVPERCCFSVLPAARNGRRLASARSRARGQFRHEFGARCLL